MTEKTTPPDELGKASCSAFQYAQMVAAEKRHLDFVNNVITSIKMLTGWEIIALLRWKPGVVRYIAERSLHGKRERQIGYAKDEVFVSVQLPPLTLDERARSSTFDKGRAKGGKARWKGTTKKTRSAAASKAAKARWAKSENNELGHPTTKERS